ncbi:replication/maintenance protein RepL, partial [Clostridium sp.]
KIKVLKFLIENRNKENLIIMTQKEISQKCNVGSQTVARTVKTLQNAKFLIRIINGTYEIKLA